MTAREHKYAEAWKHCTGVKTFFFFFLFFTPSTKTYDVATENLFIFGTRSGLKHIYYILSEENK